MIDTCLGKIRIRNFTCNGAIFEKTIRLYLQLCVLIQTIVAHGSGEESLKFEDLTEEHIMHPLFFRRVITDMLPMFMCVVNEIASDRQTAFFEMFVNNLQYLSQSEAKIRKSKSSFTSPYHKAVEEIFLNQLQTQSSETVYCLKVVFKNRLLEKSLLISRDSVEYCLQEITKMLLTFD